MTAKTNLDIKRDAMNELITIAQCGDGTFTEHTRLQAISILLQQHQEQPSAVCYDSCHFTASPAWHDASLREMTYFFLRGVAALLPAAGLAFCIYVAVMILNSAATSLLMAG
jgi:hypothetical protein